MRGPVNRIKALDPRKHLRRFESAVPGRNRTRYEAAGFPPNPHTRKCKSRGSVVVFTTRGSRLVLVSKRTRHQAARGTVHHRSSHVGRGLSGSPYAQATAGGRSARMWQDLSLIHISEPTR